jgi:DNA invertase Pin-like site-specific DNA recombinase
MRVVFYARVSSEQEEQLHSLKQQVEYFEQYIKANKDWEYAGMYVDEGITGTIAKKRPQFMKMINDAKDGKFDIILTKEVSRFARNTVDTLHYTRELKKYGVCVIFTIDNINTFDKDGELRLTIMASLAQEEARKASERTRWGHDKSMKRGIVYGNSNILGYDVVEGKLVVNKKQAEVVKLIYNLYLDGYGVRAIKMELEHRGIPTTTGKPTWQHATIARILGNEKYIGKLIQKKFITVDYLDKKRKRNQGEEKMIEMDGVHEPILSEEIFYAVQDEYKRRAGMTDNTTRYSNKFPLSSKLQCGKCGKMFRRITWNVTKDGNRKFAWQCGNRISNGKLHTINGNELGCDQIGVPESVLQDLTKQFIEQLWKDKESVVKDFESALDKWSVGEDYQDDIIEIKKNIEKYETKVASLIDMRTDGEITKSQFQAKKEEYDLIINKQKELLGQYDKKSQALADVVTRVKSLHDFFKREIDTTQPEVLAEVIKLLINKIIVHDRNHYDIYLNTDLGYNVVYDKFNSEITPLFGGDGVLNTYQSVVAIKPVLSMVLNSTAIKFHPKYDTEINVNIYLII